MEREDIRLKILQCIDEVNPHAITSQEAEYAVDPFMEEAGRTLLRMAPVQAIDNYLNFSDAPLHPRTDGSGWVELPHGFIALVSFRMEGWERPVTRPINNREWHYHRQFNKTLRGGPARPAVVIEGRRLSYYSLPAGATHTIAEALAVTDLPVGDEYPESLTDALAWLAASQILTVRNEPASAESAKQQFIELLTLTDPDR